MKTTSTRSLVFCCEYKL